ncbi:MAG: non-hydrolyzing UDP-N-acetylglucosamine 2-epimerase, partial [archaeon]
VGARPQFIKAAPVSRKIRKENTEVLVHTGQHYDENMSKVFFDELNIPKPDYNLGVGSASHGKQTGKMLIEIEKVIMKENPDYVLVYGDTNSTIAGALAASKLHISVAHVEAGLRSYNKNMPEEQNRVLTDHISDLLFCPTKTSVENLKKEGITNGVHNVGDVMYDSVLYNVEIARKKSNILENLNLNKNKYYLATIHRAENTDNKEKLLTILDSLNELDEKVVFPVHPRTNKKMNDYGRNKNYYSNIKFIKPVSYLDMLKLIDNSIKILTDSGGLQKEAYFLEKACITLREKTEWIETLNNNYNILVKKDLDKIKNYVNLSIDINKKSEYFGDGNSAKKIISKLRIDKSE